NVEIRLATIVKRIRWRKGSIQTESETSSGESSFKAPRALITVPLGVLQAGSLKFDPALPPEKAATLAKLSMGKVVRVTLCFRERFWQNLRPDGQDKTLANMSFLFSHDDPFPTWWTPMPDESPMITGWCAADCADQLSGMTEGRVIDKAVESLSALLQVEKSRVQALLVSAYFHDWDSDPFSRGAYSYVKAGGEGCQQT